MINDETTVEQGEVVDMTKYKKSEKSGQVPPYFNAFTTIRCTKAEYKVGESGKPRIDLTWEILNPLEHKTGDIEYKDLNKNPVKMMLMLDEEKGMPNTLEFHEKHGLPLEINRKNPNTEIYQGLIIDVVLTSKEDFFTSWDPIKREKTTMLDAEGKKMSKGWAWNLSMYNSMSASSFRGINRQDWSHLGT